MIKMMLVFLFLVPGYLIADAKQAMNNAAIERGKNVFNDREKGHCLLCHQLTANSEPFQGNLGPSLDGIGSRYSVTELTTRIADPRVFNPNTIMPAYLSTKDLSQVAKAYRGKTILTKQELTDLVMYLLHETSK